MTLITMPSSPAFTKSEWGFRRTVAKSESPFTGATQMQVYDKAQWYATLSLPPMKRSQAVEWQAFFMLLVGVSNTFLLGDPDAKVINGNAVSCAVAVNAAAGVTEVNFTIGAGKTLNKGSYIQFGAASASRLYMVVDNNTSNGLVTIQPKLKDAITTATPALISNPQGIFRMESNDLSWSTNEVSNYGITFSVVEAL